MEFRYLMESIFTGMVTFIFQIYITGFNRYLHKSREEALIIVKFIDEGTHTEEEIEEHRKELHHDLKTASHELYEAMLISFINLIFPKSNKRTYTLNITPNIASCFSQFAIVNLLIVFSYLPSSSCLF